MMASAIDAATDDRASVVRTLSDLPVAVAGLLFTVPIAAVRAAQADYLAGLVYPLLPDVPTLGDQFVALRPHD